MRNRYSEAFGVTRLRWHQGDPSTEHTSVVIVEVWQTTLHAGGYTGVRPTVSIGAEIQVWTRKDGEWWRVGHAGELVKAYPANRAGFDVRRWAPMASRHWSGRVTLHGWGGE
jgi:hypothetical protein